MRPSSFELIAETNLNQSLRLLDAGPGPHDVTPNGRAGLPSINPEDFRRICKRLDEALRQVLARRYGSRIKDLSLINSTDRFFLVAVIHIEVDFIVTANTRDFPNWEIET